MNDNADLRLRAIDRALDYHSRTYGPVNYQNVGSFGHDRPTTEQIIATAEKFLDFMLTDKGAQQPRGRKR